MTKIQTEELSEPNNVLGNKFANFPLGDDSIVHVESSIFPLHWAVNVQRVTQPIVRWPAAHAYALCILWAPVGALHMHHKWIVHGTRTLLHCRQFSRCCKTRTKNEKACWFWVEGIETAIRYIAWLEAIQKSQICDDSEDFYKSYPATLAQLFNLFYGSSAYSQSDCFTLNYYITTENKPLTGLLVDSS